MTYIYYVTYPNSWSRQTKTWGLCGSIKIHNQWRVLSRPSSLSGSKKIENRKIVFFSFSLHTVEFEKKSGQITRTFYGGRAVCFVCRTWSRARVVVDSQVSKRLEVRQVKRGAYIWGHLFGSMCVWGPMERKRAETSMEVKGGVAFFFCVCDSSTYERTTFWLEIII